ncbi:Ankyrin repeats (3 copies) [Legionella nautarum]|uniref:Ankyrin repeats (3 copies) n=1 Tax=Legionella nautarum TaxID=45070 RepID=A0A0W0X2B0_9GAMM|nr:F-box-like domain-containing protein [Legionella nautarum]KTD38632.1 Ankyrin repeats (3 copies) [Legionella nautarum]
MKNNNKLKEKVTVEEEVQQASIGLSEEVWLAILSELDPESLISSVQLVSRLFHRLTNDTYIWKNLYYKFFPDELLEHPPVGFDWQSEFLYLYKKEYGALKPELRKLIFLIITGATKEACKAVVSIEDLQAANFSLIRTAVQFKRQEVLAHFHSLLRQQLELKEEEGLPLAWAVLFNQQQDVHAILAAQPDLINCNALQYLTQQANEKEKEVEEVKTITMLAAEAGHLDLLQALFSYPGNDLTREKLLALCDSIVRFKQLPVLLWFKDFIDRDARFVQMAKPYTSYLATLHGANAIFKALIDPLYQDLIYWQEELKRLNSHPVPGEAVDHDAALRILQPYLSQSEPALQQQFYEGMPTTWLQKNSLKEIKLLGDDELKKLFAPWASELPRSEFNSLIESALPAACQHGRIIIISYVLNNELHGINEPIKAGSAETFLYYAAAAKQQKLVQFLLAKGAEVNAAQLKAAISKNDIRLVQDLLELAGADAPSLVNTVYRELMVLCLSRFCMSLLLTSRSESIIESLQDPRMQKLLVPYIDKEKTICTIIEQRPDQENRLTAVRNLIDFNDCMLRFPRVDKEALVEELKTREEILAVELQIEIDLEKESPNERLPIDDLKRQVWTMGFSAGVISQREKNDGGIILSLPKELAELNAYSRLVATFQDLTRIDELNAFKEQLLDVYCQAYLEGREQKADIQAAEAPLGKRKRNSADEQETKERKAPAFSSQTDEPSRARIGFFATRNRNLTADIENTRTEHSPSFFVTRPSVVIDSQLSSEETNENPQAMDLEEQKSLQEGNNHKM